MRRRYFLVPHADGARKLHEQLLLARIEERHMHVIAREDVPLDDLPKAGVTQRTDFVPALERGGTLGGLLGAAAGAAVVSIPSAAATLGGIASLAIALIGMVFGAVMASMIGVAVPNTRVRRFRDAIRDGQLLLIVDVPTGRVGEIDALVRKQHPREEGGITEPRVPVFP